MMKKPCILYIDTSDNKKTIVRLQRGEELFERQEERGKAASQMVLLLIDQLITEAQLSFNDLTGIEVNPGPGSFTGLRVGIAVAQTMGWLLDIPVNGQKGKQVEPVYENSKW